MLRKLAVVTAAALTISGLSIPAALAGRRPGSERPSPSLMSPVVPGRSHAASAESSHRPLIETFDGGGPAPKALYEPPDFVASAVYTVTDARWTVWNNIHAVARATLDTLLFESPSSFQPTTITYSAPAMRCGVYVYTVFRAATGASATLVDDGGGCRFVGQAPKASATESLPRILIQSFDSGSPPPEILYKPRDFESGHYTVTEAHWLQWNATRAVAQATLETGFAGTPPSFQRTIITYSLPAARCGVYTYTVFSSASRTLGKLVDEPGYGCVFVIA
jgi:hypothetical protein